MASVWTLLVVQREWFFIGGGALSGNPHRSNLLNHWARPPRRSAAEGRVLERNDVPHLCVDGTVNPAEPADPVCSDPEV